MGNKYYSGSDTFYTFPSPAYLQKVPEHELEEMQRFEDNLPKTMFLKRILKIVG